MVRSVSLLCLMLLAGASLMPLAARAAVVDGLYQGDVAAEGSDVASGATAAEALRQVIVRLTGRQSAATDPALAALYGQAARFVTTVRATAAGRVLVDFDPAVLQEALVRAGQKLWSGERPTTLVVLVNARAGGNKGTTDDLRRMVATTAQRRGLPVLFSSPLASDSGLYADLSQGQASAALEWAHRSGAEAVLVGLVADGGMHWYWSGPAGDGATVASAPEAVEALADRYGSVFATAVVAPTGFKVEVRGVGDLASAVHLQTALQSLPQMRSVRIEALPDANSLRLRLQFDGDAATLARAAVAVAAAGVRVLPSDTSELRWELGP